MFFGRLEERKGIRPFLRLSRLSVDARLARFELHFVGSSSLAWTPERLASELDEAALASLRALESHTALTAHGGAGAVAATRARSL